MLHIFFPALHSTDILLHYGIELLRSEMQTHTLLKQCWMMKQIDES